MRPPQYIIMLVLLIASFAAVAGSTDELPLIPKATKLEMVLSQRSYLLHADTLSKLVTQYNQLVEEMNSDNKQMCDAVATALEDANLDPKKYTVDPDSLIFVAKSAATAEIETVCSTKSSEETIQLVKNYN